MESQVCSEKTKLMRIIEKNISNLEKLSRNEKALRKPVTKEEETEINELMNKLDVLID